MRYHESLRAENFYLGIFFLAIFFFNIAEFLAIKPQFSEQTSLLVLLSYYCCIIFIIHGYINLCLEYSEFDWNISRIKLGLNLLLAFLVVALIFDRSIIAGTDTTAVSLTKVPGNYYWIFQVYALAGVAAGIGLLFHGFYRLTSNMSRQKCLIVLLSTLPPAAITVGVIGLQAAGTTITAAVVMSLAFTLMLSILVYAEEKTRLFRLLTFVPYTKERKLHKQLLAQVTDCIAINDDPAKQQSIQLKQMMREFEGAIVEHVLGYYGGNQKKTASALGVSEATVSRRARANARQHNKQPQVYSPDSVRITE